MGFKKVSRLNDEEKEILYKNIENKKAKMKQSQEEETRKANEAFNNLVARTGGYNTNKHTTTTGNLIEAKKKVSKEASNSFKKANKLTVWDAIKESGNIAKNFGLGIKQGALGTANYLTSSAEQNKRFKSDMLRLTDTAEKIKNRNILPTSEDVKDKNSINLPNIKNITNLPVSTINKRDIWNAQDNNKTTIVKQGINKMIDDTNQKIAENADEIKNPIIRKIAELAPSIGQMSTGMVAGMANPVLGASAFGTSAGGNYIKEAEERGMNEDEAFKYGTIMGAMEGATEAVGGAITKNIGKNIIKGNLKNSAKLAGLNIAENFAEEALMEPISEATATVVGGKETADWNQIGKRMLDSGIDGALVSVIMGGASAGIGSAVNVVNKIATGRNVSSNEINTAKQDVQNNIADTEVQQRLQEAQDLINNVQNKQDNMQEQQINQQQNKTAQNQTSAQINDILNNKNLPMQNYQYEKSDNVKVNNLRQDANKYFNNSEKARNYVNMLEKIITDKDIEIRLNSDLTTPNGRIANGSYSNGVITINPNSTRAGEFIAVHELTHAIGTKEMLNIVNTYRQSNAEFDSAVKNLLQNYQSTEITEEALSDISAQLFGNQDFINNVSQNNPNIFQKIYSEIKYLWHQFRGYKNQDQFIEDLYYKWTQAYNRNNKLNETSNYSIAGVKGMENAIKNDRENMMIEHSYNEALQLKKNGVDNETIRKNTNWFQDRNGDWKFEFSDKYMAIKENAKLESGKTYKLGDILNHDILFEVYPELANYNVKILSNTKANGSFNKSNKTINISDRLINNSELTEGTLIHEIQHAIQNIENFERGTSVKNSKLKYYNSLGEIEATETKSRFIEEKYRNRDMSKVAPESSKPNPQHKNLNNYLKNRNLLDKIKDSIYNYFNIKNGGNSNEINQEIVLDNTEQNSPLVDGRRRIESENNSDIQISNENKKRLEQLKSIDTSNMTLLPRKQIEHEIKALENGFNSYTEYSEYEKRLEEERIRQSQKNNQQKEERKEDNDYRLSHRPTETGAFASNISDNGLIPSDVYEHPEWYFSMSEKSYQESFNVLRKIRNNPDAKIKIYRASTKNELNVGDWVTLSKTYAKEHNERSLNSKGKVYEYTVKAKDIQYAGDDINEFGYFPSENKKFSQNNQEWQSYLEENFKPTGTRTNLKDVKLPTKQRFENSDKYSVDTFSNSKKYFDNNIKIPTKEYFENKQMQELLTEEDYEVLNKIYEKEGKTQILPQKRKTANILERFTKDKKTLKESKDILAQKIVNKGHYIDKLAESSNNKELKYMYDRNLNSFAEGQYVIGNAQTDNNGNVIGKSVNDIWKPAEQSNLVQEFSEYLLHKHNIDRSERKKYVFGDEIGPADSTRIALNLEEKYPQFKEWAKDVYKFNDNNLKLLKEAGLLSQDTIDYIKNMYPNYVTISRDVEQSLLGKSNNKTGTALPLKQATGGNSDIQPLKDAMAQQAIRIKKLINQNNLGKELGKTLKNAKVKQEYDIEIAPSELFELDTLVDEDAEGNKYYTYFEDGKQQKLEINDNLYKSLKPTEGYEIEQTLPLRFVQKVSNIHRSLLTSSNPVFIVSNFFKDLQDGAFNSKYSRKFVKNYAKALNEIRIKGKYYQSYMANGGMTNTYFDYDSGVKKPRNKFVEKIRNANEVVEQAPRIAEFISTLEDGKSLNEALYNAAEITTNFKRGGEITKAINRNGVNFLNASVQGLDKLYRNFSGQNGAKGYVNLLAKATILGVAPSILNHILLDDDEDYKDLPQNTKDLYYLFKYDDGKFIRIPKGRTLSIFGSVARRVLEDSQGQEDAWEGLAQTISNQIAPNNPLEDNILAPITAVSRNKTWYGTDLVSSRLQEELPKNQYDETTDEFSKWLGEKLNLSPKKINYVIDQYSGGIGDVLLPMITPQAKENVFKDKFTTDSVLKNKNVSKFFDELERQTQIANDSFATDEDKARVKYLNNALSDINSLYKEKREIQMSNLSKDEKKNKVREIQEKINENAEKALSDIKTSSNKNSNVKIGNEQYYEFDGELKTLTDEEKEKNEKISIETYSDFKNKVNNQTKEKKASGELTEKQQLASKDKISIIVNSDYSDEEKQELYKNYILTDEDSKKLYESIIKTGIDTDKYLSYKMQKFESDKDKNGDTIGGSKKKKILNYIKSMDIEPEQELMLQALNGYVMTQKEKNTLVKYIKNSGMKNKEMLELFSNMKEFKVKDGVVSW